MAQLQKGTTYTTGSTVTASNLNAHVDSAVLLDGAVSSQTALSASPASDDAVLISDTDAVALKKVTTTELLGTELAAWVGKGASGGTAALQIDGVDKLSVDSSGDTAVAGDLAVTGDLTVTGTGLMPSGSVTQWAGTGSAPTGWLMCDGTAVSRTAYPALFTAISTTYGIGDGSTTFNLPDMQGRVAIGAGTGRNNADDGSLTARTIGTYEGEETHTLTEAELASHSHFTMAATATTDALVASSNQASRASNTGLGYYDYQVQGTSTESTVGNSSDTGSGDAHNVMQSYLVLGGYIIKT